MSSFTIEMHYHTSEVSACARVKAASSIQLLDQCGYDAAVVTDHYTPEFFRPLSQLAWPDQVNQYLAGFHAAESAAAALAIRVFLGMEIRFAENNNDYLVYGVTRSFLLDHPDLHQLGIRRFSRLCREHGLLIYQAHPFRNGMTIINPDYLDGVEGLNANPRHDSRNDIAKAWAARYQLPWIAGSDFHQTGDEGLSGLVFPNPINNERELVKALNTHVYKIRQRPVPLRFTSFAGDSVQ